MFVVVNLPSLDGLRLQGAGNIAVTGINSRRRGCAPRQRQHRRERNHDEARRDDQRPGHRSAASAHRARREGCARAATPPSCSPRRTASSRRSRAAARSSMAAIPGTSPRMSTATARSAPDDDHPMTASAAPGTYVLWHARGMAETSDLSLEPRRGNRRSAPSPPRYGGGHLTPAPSIPAKAMRFRFAHQAGTGSARCAGTGCGRTGDRR